MKIFSIQDGAAGAFMRPFFAQSDGAAIREFGDIVNDPKHPVGQHPGDYTLFSLGSFDEQHGRIDASPTPDPLGNGVTFLITDFSHGEVA